MALTKEELRKEIAELPLFEKREVWVNNSTQDGLNVEKTKQTKQAICEIGDTKAYAFVTPGYNLLQFKDIFNPILDSIQEDAKGYLTNYGGFAMLKVFPEMEELKEDDSKFGLVALNSVDCSSAIIVKFCIEHGELHFTVPPKVAGLKKQHTGAAAQVTKDYISMVGGVKQVWKKIIKEFPKYEVVLDMKYHKDDGLALEFGAIVSRLKLGKRLTKKVKEEYENLTKEGKKYTLWDVFIKIIDEVSNTEYKSGVHRERRIDRLCQAIFDYSMVLSI